MRRFLFALSTAVVLLFGCQPSYAKQQDVVARVAGKYTITFPELRQYVIDYQYFYKYDRNIVQASDSALADMILNRMKIIDFFARGLNKDKEVLRGSIMRVLSEELGIEYYKTQFYEKYVNENAERNAYREMGKEVVYRQILLRKPKDASARALDSLRSLARKIRMRIIGGANFSYLAKRYSQDASSVIHGGLMPPLKWKTTLQWHGYNTIFHLPVGQTAVLESGEAIHIVQVDKIDNIHVPPYSQVKGNIREALHDKYMIVAANQFNRMRSNLVNPKTVRWNEHEVKLLLKWSNIPKFYETVYSDTIGYAISRGDNSLILSYPGGRVDLKGYLHLLNNVMILGNVDSINEKDLKKFILKAVQRQKLAEMARKLNLERDIFNPGTKDPDLESGIIRAYNEQVIEKQIPAATEQALRAFYRANRSTLYYLLPKVNIYAVIDSSRSVVEKAKRKLKHGVPFDKLAETIEVRTFIRERDGKIASYLWNKPPYLGKAAFKLKLFQTAGPIEYIDSSKGRHYALIECIAKREAKQLTFNDVRKTIVRDFRDYYGMKIARFVSEQLRKKYQATIYNRVLQQCLISGGAARR